VADAVESMADIFSSLIVWRGVVVAAAPPDEDHPYGHGKAEPLASAMVATMLLLAATWIAIQSVREIVTPHRAPAPFTLLVLVGVVVVKELLFRFVQGEADAVDNSAVRSDAWHHRSDAITSFAAGLGITVSLLGGAGYEAADDVAAVFAAGIIAWNGWRLLRPAMDELMDTCPDSALVERLRHIAARVPGVDNVEKCFARKSGYQYFVDMHVEVQPALTVVEAHAIAHEVKDAVRHEVPSVCDVLVHIEPSRTSTAGGEVARPGPATAPHP
jgi:cation diffusion facilitator family transporter